MPLRTAETDAASAVVAEIEAAFVAHWSLLGQWPGARLVDDRGVLRYETPLRKLPYNGVIRTAIEGEPEEVIAGVVAEYAGGGRHFYWLVHPSSLPVDLAARLAAAGLVDVETAIGMSLDLDGLRPRPRRRDGSGVEIVEVVDDEGLRAYADVVMTYWELEEGDRELVERLNAHWSGERARGRRLLALLDGRPVGKAYLSVAGPPGVAAIYGMSVRPEARGRGIAGALTEVLLAHATASDCRRVVLHSTEMARRVYARAGFVERCRFTFFATAPIWSGME